MERQTTKLLKDLYKEQKLALENYDFNKLKEVNEQIFLINDNERKEARKKQEIERDNKLARQIEEKLLGMEAELWFY